MSADNRRFFLRATLLTAIAAITDGHAETVSAPAANKALAKSATRFLNVRQFGATGDAITDDSEAFQRALTACAGTLSKPGVLLIPAGTYVVGDLVLPSNIMIRGEGLSSRLLQRTESRYIASVNPAGSGSPNIQKNTHGITLTAVSFVGQVERQGFEEHTHLLNVNACTKLSVNKCAFSGFRGDGIYIGSGNRAGIERHNENISITDCKFDGVNGNNRNAISVIDCTGLTIADCAFENCSRGDMPGAIDIEPNGDKFHRIKNITIRNNSISKCTGGVAAISVFLPVHGYDEPPRNIRIVGNRIDGNFTTNGISIRAAGDVRNDEASLDAEVLGNIVTKSLVPLTIGGVSGVVVHGNTFDTSAYAALVAHPSHGRCADITLTKNTFVKLGQRGMQGVRIFSSKRVSIRDNIFRDCGPANGGVGVALDVSATAPVMPEIRQNRFESTDNARRFALSLPVEASPETLLIVVAANQFSANIAAIK